MYKIELIRTQRTRMLVVKGNGDVEGNGKGKMLAKGYEMSVRQEIY
jgi:hypothetical protein